jgi:putative endonuclease
VFVEVRSRSHTLYGSPLESVTRTKQRKILKTATYFLKQRNWLTKFDCRFDVIGISQQNFEWIKHAFTADIL